MGFDLLERSGQCLHTFALKRMEMSFAMQLLLYSRSVIPFPEVLRRFASVFSTLKPPQIVDPPSSDQLLLPLKSFNQQTHIHSF